MVMARIQTKKLIGLLIIAHLAESIVITISLPSAANILISILSGVTVAVCLGAGIAFGARFNKSTIFIFSSILGGTLGYMLFGILVAGVSLSMGNTLKNVFYLLTNTFTKSIILVSLIMASITMASIISNKKMAKSSKIVAFLIAGSIGGLLAGVILNTFFQSPIIPKIILGLLTALAVVLSSSYPVPQASSK